jgi:hypothetical protein
MGIYSRQQSGAALFVALIILLIVSMMGVSAMKSSILSERMAFNTQARELSFQAAETSINGVISRARTSNDFVSQLLGSPAVVSHCVSANQLLVDGACAPNATFDYRSALSADAQSKFQLQRVAFDNDTSAIMDFQFYTIGRGGFVSASLPFESRNRQEWRKLGPAGGPFSVGNPADIGVTPPNDTSNSGDGQDSGDGQEGGDGEP